MATLLYQDMIKPGLNPNFTGQYICAEEINIGAMISLYGPNKGLVLTSHFRKGDALTLDQGLLHDLEKPSLKTSFFKDYYIRGKVIRKKTDFSNHPEVMALNAKNNLIKSMNKEFGENV